MDYFISLVLLFVLMFVYFRIAHKYGIIDKPNHRSAHTEITLRGGGIIFPVAFLLLIGTQQVTNFGSSLYHYLPFGIGLGVICTISFIDDIVDLSRMIRVLFHFISVSLLLYFLNAFELLPIWLIPVVYVFIIGILNAYNFMDGINGMTGLYSLIALSSLLYVNVNGIQFAESDFIVYPILACIVFLFFNFRKKAKCFMGDIGSMGIAFWVIALLGLLMIKTGELKWILFLTVYGIEVVFTILERLKLKENIFEAHRRHLYQLLVNEKKISHLTVSSLYAGIQLIINVAVISINSSEIIIFALTLISVAILYLYTKFSVKNQILSKINS